MKELTIKEKARAYDRIVEKAKIEKEKSRNLGLLEFIDENFPELKESEDEKIRKEIYSALKYLETELGWDAVGDVDILDAYAWLEKQGKQETLCDKCRKEHPSHSCQDITELGRCTIEHIQSQTDKVEPKDYSSIDPHFFKTTDKVEPKFKVGDKIRRKNPSSFDKDMQVARIEKDYYICNHIGKFSSEVVPFSEEYCYDLIEQKPADKVEPKFKVGDWVVSPNGVYWHVDAIRNSRYQVSTSSGECADWPLDTNIYHKFTIQDAKDGDVLETLNYVYIFNSFDKETEVVAFYCLMKKSDEHFSFGDYRIHDEILNSVPATKEQRDALMKAMADARFTFDFEKMEVKRVPNYCQENCKGFQENGKCFADWNCKDKREAETINKVEPKFKVGDWIVSNVSHEDYRICKILNSDSEYIIESIDGYRGHNNFETFDKDYHLWTIQDAKEGDVLHVSSFSSDCIFIFDKLDNWILDEPNGEKTVAIGHCCLTLSADNMEFGIQGPDCIEVDTVKPATKIQRDLLFKAMADAGYTFDFEKKELKEVKQEKAMHNKLTDFESSLKHIMEEAIECGDTRNLKADADMLLRLAQKSAEWSKEETRNEDDMFPNLIQPDRVATPAEEYSFNIESELFQQLTTKEQQGLWKKEIEQAYNAGAEASAKWSEEDKVGFDDAMWAITQAKTIAKDENDMGNLWYAEKWLKSLKERYTWKPSDEQMEFLKKCIEAYNEVTFPTEVRVLSSLYNDLKKLKG